MIKAIIFDFDGVLVESVDIKTAAFRELFKEFPDRVDEIAKFHIDNGGMSRFDKFEYIYENIIKRPLTREVFGKLCRNFSDLVMEKVVSAPFVKGALGFLDTNMARYDMYVVSATPENEIKDIIARRKIDKYFHGIYGSPASKEELLIAILKDNHYTGGEAIFLGDSINDYHAAIKANVRFAARILNTEDTTISSSVAVRFTDFFEFAAYLNGNRL